MAIELPGYKTVLDNQVYFRDHGDRTLLKFSSNPSNSNVELKEIEEALLLLKYTFPTEESVIDYLHEKATQVDTRLSLMPSNGRPVEIPNESLLEKALRNLPQKARRDIRAKNEACIEFIRRNTSAPKAEGDPTQFVVLRYGFIPVEVIRQHQQEGEIALNSKWYNNAFEHAPLIKQGYGESWQLKVKLEKGELPKYNQDPLKGNHITFGTERMPVGRLRIAGEEVIHTLDALYSSFDSPEALSRLEDISPVLLEKASLESIAALFENVKRAVEERQSAQSPSIRGRLIN